MKVQELNVYASLAKQCTKLLNETFEAHYPKNKAKEEIIRFLKEDNILYIAKDNETVLGFVGVSKARRYFTAYQLDLMVVKASKRYQGIGANLLDIVEHRLKEKGIMTLFLGSDDQGYKTSLSGKNLYQDDRFEHLKSIESDNHPYRFYQKQGYQIVGFIPDVYGPGNPDIIMAKRLKE